MRLILEAISGRDVLHVRSIGRQDNYVVLTAAGEAAMTQPDWGSGSAPDWGKLDAGAGRIEIALPRGSDGAAAPILVQVMSKNRFAADAVAGTATLDLAAVALAASCADGRRDMRMELPLAPQGVLTICLYQMAGGVARRKGGAASRSGGGRSSSSAAGSKKWARKGEGRTLGGEASGGAAPTSTEARREAMLAAAEKRAGGDASGSVQTKSLALQRQKQAMLGKLDGIYGRQGKAPPIGLATMSVPQLQRLLAKMSGSST